MDYRITIVVEINEPDPVNLNEELVVDVMRYLVSGDGEFKFAIEEIKEDEING